MLNIKKRLILGEDVDFDVTGTGETVTFFSQTGEAYQGNKINASHLPLTTETRQKTTSTNVDAALANISDRLDNFSAGDVLEEDLTVAFAAEDSAETIQLTINRQIKNLNGHTLTFLFPASLSQVLYESIVWQDFYNGTVVIAGGDADNKTAIYDQQDITALFRIYRCQCEVKIQYFYFVHQYSVYGISAESSAAVIVDQCHFSGMENSDSYAVNKSAANALLIDCEFDNDIEVYPEESRSGIGKALGEIFAYPGATPPEGAYLLNGQTIAGCSTLYPDFWEWVTTAGVRAVDTDTYEAELAANGVCSGFVINSAAGSVRLPKWHYQSPLGEILPVRGNGTALGLTDGKGSNFSLGVAYANFLAFAQDQYGQPVGSYSTATANNMTSTHNAWGVTSDPKNSGIVAENNASDDNFYWCIQVYNAATELSEQESAQLASEMQTKAQTNLANVDSNFDWVVESWKASDGSSWYRKYRSGWVEQGGLIVKEPDDAQYYADVAINFPAPFSTTSYSFSGHAYGGVAGIDRAVFYVKDKSKTVTGISVFIFYDPQIDTDTGLEHHGTWYACGY